ncbi:MAG: repressor LexA [Planctomycetes bacterium]|nr:repressor LexA [Planctomycetota bacterium]
MPKRGRGRPRVLTLTDPQLRLLKGIDAYMDKHRIPPTFRELADELDLSVANVCKLVQRMERNGYVTHTPGKARSLKVIRSVGERPMPTVVAIPLLGTVVAGHPLLSQENVEGELLVDAATVRTGRHFALKVRGQSMIDAGIRSGSMVIVRQQPLADHRDIVVALLNGEATIKRLHHRNGELSLLPENSRFKPIPVGPDDDFRIVGKVVAVREQQGK